MNPLLQLSGTLVNIVTVLLGAALGLLLRGRLPPRIVQVVIQAIGLVTLFIGVLNAFDLTRVNDPPGVIAALIALALGGALGEWWRLDDRLERLGDHLKRRFRGQGRFTEGFVAASLLFCVGPLTLIGSIQNGLVGDPSTLLLKSTLDGFSALALATSYGVGVAASALLVAVYQGGLALGAGAFASLVPDPASDPRVLLVNGVGGVIILGLGLRLLDLAEIRVAALLPALPLALAVHALLALGWGVFG